MRVVNRLLFVAVAVLAAGLGIRWLLLPSPRVPEVSGVIFQGPVARELEDVPYGIDAASPKSWQAAAKKLRAYGLFPQAEYCCRQLNTLAPGNAEYLADWAGVLARMGRTRESTEKYQLALRHEHPQPEVCWWGIGQNRLREEDWQGAVEALRRAPNIPRAQYLLCRVLYRRGALDEARSRLEQLLEQYPDALQFHQLMAWTLVRFKEPRKAEMHRLRTQRLIFKYLPDVTREEDDRVRGETGDELVLRTALDREMRGQGADALADLQAHLRQSWTERMAVAAAHIAFGLKRYDVAQGLYEECLRRYSDTVICWSQIGDVYLMQGREEEARAAWRKANAILGEASAEMSVAESFRKAGDEAAARRHEALARYESGKRYWRTNQLVQAVPELEAAAEALDSHAPSWFYLADALRELGDREGARAAYAKCLEINPNHGRALAGLKLLEEP